LPSVCPFCATFLPRKLRLTWSSPPQSVSRGLIRPGPVLGMGQPGLDSAFRQRP